MCDWEGAFVNAMDQPCLVPVRTRRLNTPRLRAHLACACTIHQVDMRQLRKLIIEGKLAPCYPGDEEPVKGTSPPEECPLCFLFFPILNTSKCCGKRLCTQCFLQVCLA